MINAYTLMLAAIILLGFSMHGYVRGNKKYIVIAFLLLFCIMGLRDVNAFGSDASGSNGSYVVSYRGMKNTAWDDIASEDDENYNLGFSYLMKLVYELSDGDYQTFITVISAFFMFSYAHFVKRYSPDPMQSVLYFLGLLYFLMLFDILKQAIAMSILLFAFDAVMEKKLIKFILLTLLASWFHFPALVFLPSYIIGQIKVGKRYLIVLGAVLLLTYIFREQILQLMLDSYGKGDIEGGLDGIKFLRNKVVIMIVIVVAAVALRPPTPDDRLYNTLLVFAGVAIIFQTFCGYNNIFERLADYYFQTAIVFIPLVFEKCEKKSPFLDVISDRRMKTVAPFVFCAFAAWRFATMVTNSPTYMPFRFMWQ